MNITYVYTRRRQDTLRKGKLEDAPTKVLCEIPPDLSLLENFIERDPVNREVQNCQEMSEHEVNSEAVPINTCGINHEEGGWPKDVQSNEPDQTNRYRKKIEKDEAYANTFLNLSKMVEHCIMQNNSIDIYENYFEDEKYTDPSLAQGKAGKGASQNEPLPEEVPSARLSCCMKDELPPTYPERVEISKQRSVQQICWMPDNVNKLAVAYCSDDYAQAHYLNRDASEVGLTYFFTWDLTCLSSPDTVFRAEKSLTSLQYNPKDCHIIAGGVYSGQIAFWDVRRGTLCVDTTPLESSHNDPVWSVIWIQSKTGTEFFTASTDGQVLWWDTRKLTEPTESLILDTTRTNNPHLAEGAFRLEYDPSIPTKFMVGTDAGSIVLCNRKGKTPAEKIVNVYPGHIGAVYALERNPAFNKNFLSIGDWSIRIWSEDIKDAFIIGTDYDQNLLTDGGWSPTRPGVFFVSKKDGAFDIWDFTFKQQEPVLTVRVTNESLQCLSVEPSMGELVATGASNGIVSVLNLSEGFWKQTRSERQAVGQMFERETSREKIMELRSRELKLKKKLEEQAAAVATPEVIEQPIQVHASEISVTKEPSRSNTPKLVATESKMEDVSKTEDPTTSPEGEEDLVEVAEREFFQAIEKERMLRSQNLEKRQGFVGEPQLVNVSARSAVQFRVSTSSYSSSLQEDVKKDAAQ